MPSDNNINRRDVMKAASTIGFGAAAIGLQRTAPAAAAALPAHWDVTADVVVLGYGGAGAVTAISAHDAGANVLILEKQNAANHIPNTRMAGGIYHCPAKDGDHAALKQYAVAMMSGDNLPGKLEGEESDVVDGLAEAWATGTPQVNDFLHAIDPTFKPLRAGGAGFPKFPGAQAAKYQTYLSSYTGKIDLTVPTKNLPKNQKWSGESFFACLSTGVQNRRIRVLYGTPAVNLITNGTEVLGVAARRNGKPFYVKARRAVVITSGGYEYNPAMRRAFLEGPGVKGWAFWGTPYNTGDGIAMAMSAGAALARVASVAGGLSPTVPLPGFPGVNISLGHAGSTPNSMIVDQYGQRYANESEATDDPNRYYFYHKVIEFDVETLTWPRAPSWAIFDDTSRANATIASMGFGAVGMGMVPWTTDNMDAVNRGWILSADTIAGLAAKISAHPLNVQLMQADALAKSVGRFNDLCASGKDSDFNRAASSLGPVAKPPFYAMVMCVGGPNTKGGIAANARREAIDWNDRPIPRLFTAGEVSSVFKAVYQAGGNLTECIVMGRIAGRNAAGQKPWD